MVPRWFLWTLAALVSWGLWAIASKLIGDALSPAHSQALSTLGMVPILAVLAWAKPAPNPGLPTRGRTLAVAAGLATCLGNLAYYAALQGGEKAATVIPLTSLYPVVTLGLAALFLRERLRTAQWIGVALSLLATYLFNVRTETGLISPALLVALPPIGFWGLSGLLQKSSTNHVSGEVSALWFLVAFIPVSFVILALHPLPSTTLSPRLWLLATALGLFLAFGNLAILAAFAAGGRASVIAPLGGLYPLVSIPIALACFGETTSTRENLGILLAVTSVLALSLESNPNRTPPTPTTTTTVP